MTVHAIERLGRCICGFGSDRPDIRSGPQPATIPLTMIDSSNDPIQVKARVSAAHQSDQSVNALIALDPSVCEATDTAVTEIGAKVNLS
jgi:hypothetical protein